MAKLIPLTQEKFALIDDEDFELVSQYKWCAYFSGGNWYARSNAQINYKRVTLKLHTLVLGKILQKVEIDHVNRDGLDNRKENLRVCTHQENSCNRRKRVGKSQFKGVQLFKGRKKKWMAQIGANQKKKFLGYFENEIDAAKAYNKAAIDLHGEFACINIIDMPKVEESNPPV